MVSKRIKYARAHLTPRRHIAILARPIWRRSYLSPDSNCLPRPFSVCRAALRARPSKRIKMMAQPKSVQRRFDRAASQSVKLPLLSLPPRRGSSLAAHRRLSLQYPRAHRGSLLLETRNRLFDLALPKKSALMHARRLARNRATLANINSLLQGVRKSRYQKYRIICEALQRRAAAREEKIRRKLRRALSKPGDWEKHNRALERLAAPKRRPPKPPRPTSQRGRRRAKQRPAFDPQRLELLAQPSRKQPSRARDPFQVARSALVGAFSEHVLELAQRDNPRPVPRYREPGQVLPRALRAHASERILELAKPAVRPPGLQTDLKEDAFSVPPLALKAKCRPRIKILARPKTRGRRAKA
ncbi:uncharacterized protein LOC100679689 isoform X1 [Nasonia vitripennis]|uniref:Uncharacterized protein n=1 Tax=Nasonia vitripennis TaxID=7425 RepID=A0A7M7H396_NASVI|nr:uncharacterized protein LOC100679689 isoform X1 [Nasonia vitripennis]